MNHRKTTVFHYGLFFSMLFLMAITGTLWASSSQGEVYVSEAVTPVILNVDLRDLPRADPWRSGDPIKVVPEGLVSNEGVESDPLWEDPLRQTPGPSSFAAYLGVDFPGIAWSGGTPPDTVGDVGPNHYILMANSSRFMIFDKAGNILVGVTEVSDLWTGGSSPCQDGDGDPIVVYDGLADRWFLSEFDVSGNTFCLYISQGADPVSSGWYSYAFSAPSFPDYPKFGVWPDAYYASTFENPVLGIYAFDRAKMLAGQPATFQRFTLPMLSGSSPRVTRILPSDVDGVAPPAGSPNYFLRSVHSTQDSGNPTTRLEVWEFSVDWVTPGNSTLTQAPNIIPAPFSLLGCSPGVRDCIPQPGTSNLIDALFNRVLRQLQYRNFGNYQTMVVNQVVDVGAGLAGKRWWELRKAIPGPSDWAIHQEGTYAPDGVYRFMGSVAMNGDGDIALGYSVSDGNSVLPGMRATARRATDPLGTMPMAELTIKEGIGVQTSSQRWGDYSSMNVDPADDQTFWFTSEIIQPNGRWITHVGSFKIDPVFSDGFESGDTSAWSAAQP